MGTIAAMQCFERGDRDYESARREAVWNGRVPDRFPDLIVRPDTEADVVVAMRHARDHGMRVGVRSGGHSWDASFLRDGGILVDLSRLTKVGLDVDSGIAFVEPAAHGGDLNAMLGAYRRMFPVGHCPSVGIGGFLLQGGFGWNSRAWGVGAQSVLAIDVVTADGELVHADREHHAELYWAARGAGPGFFGVVTRFHLATHPLPRAMMTSTYRYPLHLLDELLLWLERIQPLFPDTLEVSMMIGSPPQGGLAEIELFGDALSDTTSAAHAGLSLLETFPRRDEALSSNVMNSVTLPALAERFEEVLDARGRRYEVDNMWTSAPVAQVLPELHAAIDALPEHPSHLYLLWWGDGGPRDDMAFSLQGKLFVALYAISADPSSDAAHKQLVVDRMRALEPWADGIQLADENLEERPFRFMADENFARLERARQLYDAEGRFHSYLGIPTAREAQ